MFGPDLADGPAPLPSVETLVTRDQRIHCTSIEALNGAEVGNRDKTEQDDRDG